jgi:hypothetical protein
VVAENKIYFRRDARNAKNFPPRAFSATTAVNISNREVLKEESERIC